MGLGWAFLQPLVGQANTQLHRTLSCTTPVLCTSASTTLLQEGLPVCHHKGVCQPGACLLPAAAKPNKQQCNNMCMSNLPANSPQNRPLSMTPALCLSRPMQAAQGQPQQGRRPRWCSSSVSNSRDRRVGGADRQPAFVCAGTCTQQQKGAPPQR